MLRQFFPLLGTAQHLVFFGAIFIAWFLCRPEHLSHKNYMHKSVDGAKQAAMQKHVLIIFCGGGVYPHY